MTLPHEPRLLVILGPTGTGKSELAVRVAERLDGEILGCDALQVYRGFDVATAKPGSGLRARVPHHLVDAIDPNTGYNMADYVRQAERVVAGVATRRRVPLVVGGTGMYLRGLLRGVIHAPPRRPEFRARLHRIVGRGGLPRLRRWLERLDPDSARRIPEGDVQRTLRAIELGLESTGPWSERLRFDGTWAARRERFSNVKIGLDMERAALVRRLDARVDRFFATGLVEEVRALLRSGVPPTARPFKAIGYREVLAALERKSDPGGPEVRAEIQRNTRRYAKRQRTWFRREPDVVWLDAACSCDELTSQIMDLWRRS